MEIEKNIDNEIKEEKKSVDMLKPKHIYVSAKEAYVEAKEKLLNVEKAQNNLSKELELKIQEFIKHKENERAERERQIRTLLFTGKKYYRAERYEEAIAKWEEILIIDVNNVEVREEIKQAEEALKLKKEKKIFTEEEKLIQEKEIREHLNLGKKYYREEEYRKSIEELEVALALGGDEALIREDIERAEKRLKEIDEELDRAKLQGTEREKEVKELDFAGKRYQRMEEFEKAIASWEKALILDPEHQALRDQIRRAEAQIKEKKRTKERIDQDKNNKIKEHQVQAMRYFREQEYKKAIEEWESVLILDGTKTSSLESIKQAEIKLVEIEEEKQRIVREPEERKKKLQEVKREADREKERNIQSLYSRGWMFFNNEEYAKAIEEWEKILLIDNKNEKVKKDIEKAEDRIESAALKKEQQSLSEKKRIEQIKAKEIEAENFYRNKEYTKAIKVWEALLMMGLSEGEIREKINRAEARIKELEEKSKIRIKEEQEKNEKLKILMREGELFYWQEDYLNAIAKWEEALILEPEHASLLEAIRKAEEKIVEIKDKKMQEEKAKIRRENEIANRKKLALKLEASELYAQAIEEWEKILESDPNYEQSLTYIKNLKNTILKQEKENSARERELKEKEEQIFKIKEREREEHQKKINEFLSRGRKLFLNEEYEKAIEEWEQILQIDLNNHVAKDNISLAETEIYKRKQLADLREKEHKERKEEIAALMVTAVNYRRHKEYKKAIHELEKVLLLDFTREDVLEEIKSIEQEERKEIEANLQEQKEQVAKVKLMEAEKRRERERLKEQINESFSLGVKYYNNREYEKSIEEWMKILLLDTDNNFAKEGIRKSELKIQEVAVLKQRKIEEEKEIDKFKDRHISVAEQYYQQQKYDQAIDEWRKVLSLIGEDNEIERKINEALARIRERDEQIVRLEQERLNKEKEIAANLVEAEKALGDGDLKKAIESWEKVLLIDPRRKDVLSKIEDARRRIDEQRERAQRYAFEKERKIKNLMLEGIEFYREEDYVDAIKKWEEILVFEPENEDICEKIKEAEEKLKALEESKERERREHEEKIKLIENEKVKAAERRNEQIKESFNLGITYYNDEEYIRAIEEWKKILLIDPMHELVREEIRRAEAKIQEREMSERRQLQEERERARNIEKYFSLGRHFYEIGEHGKAIAEWERLIDFGVERKEIEVNINKALEQIKEAEEERERLKKQKEENERMSATYLIAAEKALGTGDLFTAIDEWGKIVLMDSSRKDIFHKIEEARRFINEENDLKRKYEAEREKQIKRLSIEAIDKYHDRKYVEAIKKWEEVLVLNPEREDIVERIRDAENAIAAIKEDIDEGEKIEREKEEEKEINRRNRIEVHFENAIMFEKDNDLLRAVGELEKILLLDEKNIIAKRNIERIEKELDLKEQKEQYTKTREEEKSRKVKECIAAGNECYRNGEYGKAINAWEQAYSISGKRGEVEHLIEKAENKIREHSREQEKYQKEIDERAKQCKEKLFNADNLYAKGEYEKAREEWGKALNLDPDCVEAKHGIQNSNLRIEEVNKKFKQEEEKINELLFLGLELENKKQYPKLIEVLKKILFFEPEREEIKEKLVAIQQIIDEDIESEKQQKEQEKQEKERKYIEEKEEKERQAKEIEEHYSLGMKYLREDDYERAIEELGYILLVNPNNRFVKEKVAWAEKKIQEEVRQRQQDEIEKIEREKKVKKMYFIGQQYYRKGEYLKAIEVYEEILFMEPKYKEVEGMIKQCELRLKESRDGEERLLLEKRQREEEVKQYYTRGEEYYYEGKLKEAIEEWNKALEIEPEAKGIKESIRRVREQLKEKEEKKMRYVQKKIESIKTEKEKSLKFKEDEAEREKINQLIIEGRKYFRNGDYEQAIKEWEDVLLIDADNKTANDYITKAFREIKKEEEIKERIEKEEAEKEKQINLCLIVAHKYFVNQEYEKTVEEAKKIIAIDPYRENALELIKQAESNMARLKIEKQKQLEEPKTLKKKEEALKKEKEQAQEEEIKYLYATGLEFYREGLYEKAIDEWKRILFLDKNYQLAKDEIANAEGKMLKRNEELEKIEKEKKEQEIKKEREIDKKLIEQRIKNINQYNINARRSFRKGYYEKAIEEWEKILMLDSSNVEIQKNIEDAELKIKEKEEIIARKIEQKAIKIEEKMAEKLRKKQEKKLKVLEKKGASERIKDLFRIAKECFESGKYNDAKDIFNQILELSKSYKVDFLQQLRVRNYIREIESKEEENLRMKAKIMATTSNISVEKAIDILRNKNKNNE